MGLILQHCPSNCHSHVLQTFSGVAGGSFTAPDHEYPSYLELELTATDSGGLTDTRTVRLDPQTVILTFQTDPEGLKLAVNSASSKAPFTRTVIVGSTKHHQRSVSSNEGQEDLHLQLVVRRRCPDPQHRRPAPTARTYTAQFSDRS